MKNRALFYWLIAAALGIVLLTYSNHFHNNFEFDDWGTIGNNMYIRDLRNIPSFFWDAYRSNSSPTHQGYRPLLTALNALEYHLGGKDPFCYHIFSFSFYLLVCAAYYCMLRYIFNLAIPSPRNDLTALLAAMFYSVHTVNAETVNYIHARSDLLAALMAIAAFCIYIYGKGKRYFSLYLIFLALGFFAKNSIGIFPLLLFFYIFLFEQKLSLPGIFDGKNFSAVKKAVRDTVPSGIVSALMLIFTFYMARPIVYRTGVSRWDYVLAQPAALLHYFISFFIPSGLCVDIPFQRMRGILDERVIIGCVFIAVMVAWAVKTSKTMKERPIAFGILWFFITSIPTSCGVVALSESMNDHRMFFPLFGLMMAAAWSVKLLLDKYRDKIRHNDDLQLTIVIAFLLVFTGHACGTHQRNKVWKDGESLWHDVVIKYPDHGRGLMNYGLALMGRGDYKGALHHYERALFYYPRYVPLHVNLGIVKGAMGDTVQAEEFFRKAIDLDRSNPTGYFYYARYLSAHNRQAEAVALLKTCLELSPGHADAQELLKTLSGPPGADKKVPPR